MLLQFILILSLGIVTACFSRNILGKKSNDPDHPDYVPSIFPEADERSAVGRNKLALSRFHHRNKRERLQQMHRARASKRAGIVEGAQAHALPPTSDSEDWFQVLESSVTREILPIDALPIEDEIGPLVLENNRPKVFHRLPCIMNTWK